MSECKATPPPLTGTLALYQTSPIPLPYFESNGSHPNKLVFIPGLTDTMGVVPYLPRLAQTLDKIGYSLVQFVKCSDLGGFGTSSLEGDAQEIAQLVEHLKSRDTAPCTGKLVVMGHSTGCQDVIQLLSRDRALSSTKPGSLIHIDGGICQAPVSDYEFFKHSLDSNPLGQQQWAESQSLLDKGKPSALLSREHVAPVPASTHGRGPGNSEVALNPAFTAYRFASLNGPNGDDDFFSTNLPDERVQEVLQPALSRASLLMLLGEEEYVFCTN